MTSHNYKEFLISSLLFNERNMIHHKTEQSLEHCLLLDLGGRQPKLGLGHNTYMEGCFHAARVRSLAFHLCDPNIDGCMYWDHSIRAWNQCKGVI